MDWHIDWIAIYKWGTLSHRLYQGVKWENQIDKLKFLQVRGMTWPRFTTVGHSLYYAWSSHKSAQLPSCQPHTNNNSNTTTGLYTDLKLARRDCDPVQLGPLSLPTTPCHELEHRYLVKTCHLTFYFFYFFFLNCPSRFINCPPKLFALC